MLADQWRTPIAATIQEDQTDSGAIDDLLATIWQTAFRAAAFALCVVADVSPCVAGKSVVDSGHL